MLRLFIKPKPRMLRRRKLWANYRSLIIRRLAVTSLGKITTFSSILHRIRETIRLLQPTLAITRSPSLQSLRNEAVYSQQARRQVIRVWHDFNKTLILEINADAYNRPSSHHMSVLELKRISIISAYTKIHRMSWVHILYYSSSNCSRDSLKFQLPSDQSSHHDNCNTSVSS